jgi:PKD repeat protein
MYPSFFRNMACVLLALATMAAFGQDRKLNIRESSELTGAPQVSVPVQGAELPAKRNCGTLESEKTRGILASSQVEELDAFEQWLQQTAQVTRARSARLPGPQVYTLPVVVHVIYSQPEENISDAQVLSQLKVLNQDYRRRNPDRSLTPGAFNAVAADPEIEFCLASTDPQGNPTNGIHRVSIPGSPFNERYINEQIKPATIWDPTQYMNIWVCNLANGMLGFAQFPVSATVSGIPSGSTAAETDGVVISYIAFGTLGTAQSPYNHGRTTTHEVGHWLGLRHIWGDGACGIDDYCKDTPEVDGPFYGCPSANAIDCNGGLALTTNFMDYCDDACMNIFTLDQKVRMRTVIENSPRRKELLESQVCQRVLPPADPEFVADIQSGCTPLTVKFNATNIPPGATVTWTFPGGKPSSSSDPQPKVTYREGGSFPVSLRIVNSAGPKTTVKQAFIQANSRGKTLPVAWSPEAGEPAQSGFTQKQGSFLWQTTPAVDAFGGSGSSLVIKPGTGTGPAWLISPQLDLATGQQSTLTLDYAYAPSGGAPADSLGIFVSTGCSAEFSSVWFSGGAALATAPFAPDQVFLPAPDQWKTLSVDLSAFDGMENVQVAVLFYGKGGGFYLDNLQIAGKSLPAPVANFTASEETICQGSTVQFKDLSDNHPTRWLWSFPGGNPSTDTTANPVVRYPVPGIYDVVLTVFSPHGQDSRTENALIAVQASPEPVLKSSRTDLCSGEEAVLSVTGITGLQWTMNGIPLPYSTPSIRVQPTEDAIFQVSGTADQGCRSSASLTLRVRNDQELQVVPAQPVVCRGGEIELTASGADTYRWAPAEGLSVASGGRVVVRPLKTTTYVVEGSRASGCVLRKSVTVTVEDAAAIQVSPEFPKVCLGEQLELVAGGGQAYEWSAISLPKPVAGSRLFIAPLQTSVYNVKAISARGCTVEKQVRVEVGTPPKVSLRAFPEIACEGDEVELMAYGAKRYTWFPASQPFEISPVVTKLRAKASTDIWIVGENEGGCTDTARVSLVVRPAPVISILNLHPYLCPGQTTALEAQGAASYSWLPNPDIRNIQGGRAMVTLSRAEQRFSVTGTDEEGCAATAETVVKMATQAPLIPDFITPVSLVCVGQEVGFIDRSVNATDYFWEFPGGTPAVSREPNPKVTYSAPGVYDVVLNVRGCNAENRLERKGWIVVNEGRGFSLNASDQTICQGEPFRLVVQGGTDLKWSPAIGLSHATGPEVWATPSTRTTYTVEGRDLDGCAVKRSVTFDVIGRGKQLQVKPFSAVVCKGEKITLTATGAESYSWFPQRGLNRYDGPTVTASPEVTTRYTVEGVDLDGCVFRDTVLVRVEENPKAMILAAQTRICRGDSIALETQGEGVVSWSNATGTGQWNGYRIVVFPEITTQYLVTLIRPNGCTAMGSIEIAVSEPGDLSISVPKFTVCKGESITLTASGTSQPVVWSPASSLSSTTGFQVTAKPLQATTYIATTGSGSCQTQKSVTLEVIEPRPLQVTPGFVRICEGKSVSLVASGGSRYEWQTSGSFKPTTAQLTVSPQTTTRYVVKGLDPNGCMTEGSAVVTVEASDFAQVAASQAVACAGEPVVLEGKGGVNYRWIGPSGAQLLDTTRKVVINRFQPGAYRLVATSETGCTDTSSIQLEIRDLKPDFSLSQTSLDLAVSTGSIHFSDLTAQATQWKWEFGDGGFSTEKSPSHIYYQPGDYEVTLTVSDGVCMQKTTKKVTVRNSSSLAELEAKGRILVENKEDLGKVDLAISSPRPMQLVLSLKNQTGIEVLEGVLRIPQGEFREQLNLLELAVGSYVLTLSDGNQLMAFPVEVN